MPVVYYNVSNTASLVAQPVYLFSVAVYLQQAGLPCPIGIFRLSRIQYFTHRCILSTVYVALCSVARPTWMTWASSSETRGKVNAVVGGDTMTLDDAQLP